MNTGREGLLVVYCLLLYVKFFDTHLVEQIRHGGYQPHNQFSLWGPVTWWSPITSPRYCGFFTPVCCYWYKQFRFSHHCFQGVAGRNNVGLMSMGSWTVGSQFFSHMFWIKWGNKLYIYGSSFMPAFARRTSWLVVLSVDRGVHCIKFIIFRICFNFNLISIYSGQL